MTHRYTTQYGRSEPDSPVIERHDIGMNHVFRGNDAGIVLENFDTHGDRDSVLNNFNQNYLAVCQKDIYSEGN